MPVPKNQYVIRGGRASGDRKTHLSTAIMQLACMGATLKVFWAVRRETQATYHQRTLAAGDTWAPEGTARRGRAWRVTLATAFNVVRMRRRTHNSTSRRGRTARRCTHGGSTRRRIPDQPYARSPPSRTYPASTVCRGFKHSATVVWRRRGGRAGRWPSGRLPQWVRSGDGPPSTQAVFADRHRGHLPLSQGALELCWNATTTRYAWHALSA